MPILLKLDNLFPSSGKSNVSRPDPSPSFFGTICEDPASMARSFPWQQLFVYVWDNNQRFFRPFGCLPFVIFHHKLHLAEKNRNKMWLPQTRWKANQKTRYKRTIGGDSKVFFGHFSVTATSSNLSNNNSFTSSPSKTLPSPSNNADLWQKSWASHFFQLKETKLAYFYPKQYGNWHICWHILVKYYFCLFSEPFHFWNIMKSHQPIFFRHFFLWNSVQTCSAMWPFRVFERLQVLASSYQSLASGFVSQMWTY